MTAKSCLFATVALACTLLVGACASELPAGAPPVDPYGPPTAMNEPHERANAPSEADTPDGGQAAPAQAGEGEDE
jgi:hypothetical protein